MTDDHFQSLDQTIAAIRAECEAQVKAANDSNLAAQIEATLLREQLAKAQADRDLYMRVAERLVTQFAVVEKVFADAKAFALTIPKPEFSTEPGTVNAVVPANKFGELQAQLDDKAKELAK